MKRILYFALFAVILTACGQSQEQKAEALIKESLKKTLYKPETYKPVETKVDSAFAPNDDPALYHELAILGEMNSQYEDLEDKAKHAKSSMSLWEGPYLSSFEKNEYKEAKAEYDDANAEIEKLKKKGRKQYEKVANMLQTERSFIGFKAFHNYRADNNAGNTLIGNSVFFIDKEFKEITFGLELEDYNQIQESIRQFMEQMEEEEE